MQHAMQAGQDLYRGHLRPLPGGAGLGQGLAGLGRGRQGIHRPGQRHRRERLRHLGRSLAEGRHRAAGQAPPRLEPLLHRALREAGGDAVPAHGHEEGVLRQLRRGGQRVRHQGGPQVRRREARRGLLHHRDAGEQLPRPHADHAVRHRPGPLPRAVPAADPGLCPHPRRGPGRAEGAGEDHEDRRGADRVRAGRGRRGAAGGRASPRAWRTSAPPTTCCWWWTRCRPATAAAASCTPT